VLDEVLRKMLRRIVHLHPAPSTILRLHNGPVAQRILTLDDPE
jgi:hypothetical protein